MHFYIIFGTNLLCEGPVQIVFLPISVFCRKGISNGVQTEMKPSGESFLEQTQSRRLGVDVKEATRRPRGREARPHPRGSTDLLLSPIYTHIPRKHLGAPRNPISTAATFYTREIPSWGLFWRSAGGGIDHEGLLHQHHSLSNDV